MKRKRVIRSTIIGALIFVTILSAIFLTRNKLIPAYRYSAAMDLISDGKIYLPEEASRLGSETTFAIFQYGKFDDNSPSWWLRTPGFDNQNALLVADSGEIFEMGAHVTFASPIRPAIWVDLSSDVFVR